MAKKKTAPVKAAPEVRSEPVHTEQALIKFDNENILKLDYDKTGETLTVKNVMDGKAASAELGVVKSFIPTITITFKIAESLGNESTLNLLRNSFTLIKKEPAAEFRLNSTSIPVEPGATGTFVAEGLVYRYTGSNYIAYADYSNLNGLIVAKSDMVNCTSGDTYNANINITDQTKDASITYTLSAPAPDPEPAGE